MTDATTDAMNATSESSTMLRDVIHGLSREQKELSPKYFYDTRGSELFEAITRLPEYYPTSAEYALLRAFAAEWLETFSPCALIELGAGSAEKTRVLLDALGDGATFVPVDISAEFLQEVALELVEEYPALDVQPAVSDITQKLRLPSILPRPAVYAFLGSTIGNFERNAAISLLRNVRLQMRREDRFLLGVDLKKDRAVLEAAYNDAQGITAEFNRNVLHVLNRELGADFDVDMFDHHAPYNDAESRIEMHLVARSAQDVSIPGWTTVRFEAGESIRTEISTKYDRETITALFAAAGLEVEHWNPDDRNWYALVVGRCADTAGSGDWT